MTVATDQESKKHPIAITGREKDIEDPIRHEGAKEVTRNGRNNKRLIWSIISLIIFAILTVIVWVWWDQVQILLKFITDQEEFGAYLQSFGIWGPIVLFGAQMLQVFVAFIPGHVVLIASAYVYGFPLGFFFNITFTVIASQLAYLFARWAGRPLVYRLADRETVDYWERIANQKGVLFFTIAFLLPIFPSDAMNFVAGLSGMGSRRFLVANFFGRLPSAIMLSLIGAYGLAFTNIQWGLILLAFIVLFIAGHFVVNHIKRSVEDEEVVTAESD